MQGTKSQTLTTVGILRNSKHLKMYKKAPKPKLKEDVKLFFGNLVRNVKGKIKGDGIRHLKKFHNDAYEVAYCKERDL